MTYLIDPTPVYDGRWRMTPDKEATVVLVGCGGTGSFLAEAICRLLIDRDAVHPPASLRRITCLTEIVTFLE